MKHRLAIYTDRHPEALERVLRVTRHRGFELLDLLTSVTEDSYAVKLEVKGDKPIHLLTTQLAKLFDVKGIELYSLHQEYQLAGH